MSNVAFIKQLPPEQQQQSVEESLLKTFYDSKNKIGWFLMRGQPRPSFSLKLLDDLSAYLEGVKQEMKESNGEKYDYLVVGSDVEGVFNLGGDLELFGRYIRDGDREALMAYAMKCIGIVYENMFHFDLDLTTISLVQGDALGGGFECALSSNIIVAERGVKMGLPEVLFNLFPGMGAYSLLSRKIGFAAAEKMIVSGRLFTAEQLYDMGVVDILAEPGDGEVAIYRYVKSASRASNTFKSMQRVKDICNQVSFQEMADIAAVWADSALQLGSRDLRMMERIVRRQNRKIDAAAEEEA